MNEMIEVSKEHMRDETLNALLQDFESKAHRDENDIEFWYARELQLLLGYNKWENFLKTIQKSIISAFQSNQDNIAKFG